VVCDKHYPTTKLASHNYEEANSFPQFCSPTVTRVTVRNMLITICSGWTARNDGSGLDFVIVDGPLSVEYINL